MPSGIYIGLSGMNAFERGLQTISNNVANMNTNGYKATTTNFSDVFNHSGNGLAYAGGTDGHQPGDGVRFSAAQIDFGQGDLRQTGGDLDLAIQGSGFLILQKDGTTYYGRTGQFGVGKDGYVVMQGTDYRLGVLDNAGHIVPLSIDTKTANPPTATTKIVLGENLSSSGTTAQVSSVVVYDASGAQQTWDIKLERTNTASTSWNVTVTTSSGTVGTGTIKFTGGLADPAESSVTLNIAPPGGSPTQVVLDFSKVTSYSTGTASTIRTSSVDGYGIGTLSTITVDGAGAVQLNYSNGQKVSAGLVAMADFRDRQALERVSDGLFQNRGQHQAQISASGVGSVGTLVSRQIEASNVSLSQEFGELILIQRGFQASSQVVSISNDMIQQLFGIRGQG